jgi:uncharacterized protein (DUF2267 family)
MSIPVHCRHCGLSFTSRALRIENSAGTTISNCAETCPRCGRDADIQDGTYDFVGNVMTAFRSLDRSQVERFREVVQRAARGELDREEAKSEAAEIHKSFAQIIAQAMQWGIPALLVAIISLYLQWSSTQDSRQTTEEIVRQLHQQSQTNELILQQLNRLSEVQSNKELPSRSAPSPSVPLTPTSAERLNRHERRKLWALSRRGKPTQT